MKVLILIILFHQFLCQHAGNCDVNAACSPASSWLCCVDTGDLTNYQVYCGESLLITAASQCIYPSVCSVDDDGTYCECNSQIITNPVPFIAYGQVQGKSDQIVDISDETSDSDSHINVNVDSLPGVTFAASLMLSPVYSDYIIGCEYEGLVGNNTEVIQRCRNHVLQNGDTLTVYCEEGDSIFIKMVGDESAYDHMTKGWYTIGGKSESTVCSSILDESSKSNYNNTLENVFLFVSGNDNTNSFCDISYEAVEGKRHVLDVQNADYSYTEADPVYYCCNDECWSVLECLEKINEYRDEDSQITQCECKKGKSMRIGISEGLIGNTTSDFAVLQATHYLIAVPDSKGFQTSHFNILSVFLFVFLMMYF